MGNLVLEKKERRFVPETFIVEKWEDIEPYYQKLLDRPINDKDELRNWLNDRSELESIITENAGWRYIRMTCDTANKSYQEDYTYFISEIEPKIAPLNHRLNQKQLNNPFLHQLNEPAFVIMKRELEKEVRIYRQENIPLKTQIQNLAKEYGSITGAMTIELDDKELTLQQAAVYLESTDRKKREEVYQKINKRRLADKDKLDDLFNQLIRLRHQVAKNADFTNFRDYMFTAMGRFDYTPRDCFDFHESTRSEIVPLLNALAKARKNQLNVPSLRPWDKAVDPTGKPPLRPFSTSEELIDKSIENFSGLDPFLGECLKTMKAMKHLDLESRKGKAPGGYNYPLLEIGVPFIFMNATSTLRDLVTIVHEGGHAVHSIVTRDLELANFKETPSEVAELASMSMELLSMDHWDIFFERRDDLLRAKRQHLEQIIQTLPWVATIDKFQHWIYEHPQHTVDDRVKAWNTIFNEFTDDNTDWTGLQQNKDYTWQKQLHLFEVPFYYIEYGFAQLGAIAIWKNFRENRKMGLQNYLNALKLGYTRSIPEIYEVAGIQFDFSKKNIHELIAFVRAEWESLV